jgi:hypothetical protein
VADEVYKQVGHGITNNCRVALNVIQNQFLDVWELDPTYVKSVLSYDFGRFHPFIGHEGP